MVQRLPERSVSGYSFTGFGVQGKKNCAQLLKGFRFGVQGKTKAQIEPARGAIAGSETV